MAKKGSTTKVPAPVKIPSVAEVMAQAVSPTISLPVNASGLSMADLPMDMETRADIGPRILSIRELQGYPNAALSVRMESVWGVFTAIRTGSDGDDDKSLIFVFKGDPKDPLSVPVNRLGAQNLVNFSLLVPLQKLGVRPAADRQWDIVAQEVNVSDGPPVFVFNLVERESSPRNLKAEKVAAGGSSDAGGGAKGGAEQGAGPAPSTPDSPHGLSPHALEIAKAAKLLMDQRRKENAEIFAKQDRLVEVSSEDETDE